MNIYHSYRLMSQYTFHPDLYNLPSQLPSCLRGLMLKEYIFEYWFKNNPELITLNRGRLHIMILHTVQLS